MMFACKQKTAHFGKLIAYKQKKYKEKLKQKKL